MANKTYVNPDPKVEKTGILVTFEGVNPPKRNVIIESFNDNPIIKIVVAKTDNGIYKLWEGDSYTAIGDWTTQQAINRVKELVLSNSKGF